MQFVLLKRSIAHEGGTYDTHWDGLQSGIDPLIAATGVTADGWSADLTDANFADKIINKGRVLVEEHQLNRNYYKHNGRHVVGAPQMSELQHYIILGDAVDGAVLAESPL